MRSALALHMPAHLTDRVIIRTIALWRVRDPRLDPNRVDAAQVSYMIETWGFCL